MIACDEEVCEMGQYNFVARVCHNLGAFTLEGEALARCQKLNEEKMLEDNSIELDEYYFTLPVELKN